MSEQITRGEAGLGRIIDHTLLSPEKGKDSILQLCEEAKQYHFFSVCILPTFISLAKESLKGSDVKVCTVVGFPLGANHSTVKAFETEKAINNGADEIDMVINIGALKDGNYELVKADIKSVVDAASGKLVKVILETCFLTDEEKVKACELSMQAGANFVKTSTGFAKLKGKPTGATIHDITLMRKTVGDSLGVKASGGVKSKEQAIKMIEAGASRIGTSSGIQIVNGA